MGRCSRQGCFSVEAGTSRLGSRKKIMCFAEKEKTTELRLNIHCRALNARPGNLGCKGPWRAFEGFGGGEEQDLTKMGSGL